MRSAAEAARSDYTAASLGSLYGCQISSQARSKPLQMSRVMSACSRTSIVDHSGLREAQVARASTVRGRGVQRDD